ncbi:N-acetylmuramoyl-L-alanine amidase [Clostridium tagluense]|uniref:N-acetylmuramoyl-L-alanine amidase n=1 Tax=Clostridium tagluense TaxID=360422 RepID=UPI001C6F17A6|nr:N-acetylmuramoyl-L-alanine amidase [Clostridium tagluense]MBW9159349.1 N-acetylmuramoyl-L-alanine amidase [Clostridium tagluense]WLC68076.1 N-acetylmuramoyl-L-alanine amidase [Clostridium tagluense]
MNIVETNFKWNGNLTYNNTPKMIVLHHAEAKHAEVTDIHDWHVSNGWCGIGYHYYVKKNGKIFRGRPEKAQGSHCPGVNRCSISISAEGDFMTEKMNEIQKQAIINLCKDICRRYGFKDIKGHKEVPYPTDCPGTNYPLREIKKLVLNSNNATETQIKFRKECVVTASILNCRVNPVNGDIIKTYKLNDKLTIVDFNSDKTWGKLSFGDSIGWVSMAYVK